MKHLSICLMSIATLAAIAGLIAFFNSILHYSIDSPRHLPGLSILLTSWLFYCLGMAVKDIDNYLTSKQK